MKMIRKPGKMMKLLRQIAFLTCFVFLTISNGQRVDRMSSKDVEERSLKAIKAIHKHLDDDQDGDVNLQESNEFMLDELQLNDQKRHSNFHGNDSLISVEDLWNSWRQSEAHNWTNEQVIGWLSNIVGLPQYGNVFGRLKIDGRMLPRFTNESSTLYGELGISNVKHRKKIYLRATDIVLFGIQPRGYTKDIILTSIVILMTVACLYAFHERKYAKKQIEQMIKDVEFMQQAEENLKSTQDKLLKAEMEHNCTVRSKREIEEKLKEEMEIAKREAERLHVERSHHEEERIKMTLVEQELIEVRRALQKAEAEMESMATRSPKSLQQWLHITYRKESKHFMAKKNRALKQMEEAKEACDKIRRKRSSMFGPLRLVHGQSIDEVDQKILQARSALAEVTNDLQERQHRWRQIEELCGFPIVSDGLLGHSMEIEEPTRKSSIAQALAVCANLGAIGSFPDPNRRTLPVKECQPESPRNSTYSQQKITMSDSEIKMLHRNVSLVSDASGRSSPACILQDARESSNVILAQPSVEQPERPKSLDVNRTLFSNDPKSGMDFCEQNGSKLVSESGYQLIESEIKSLNGDGASNGGFSGKDQKLPFHVSRSTPAFSSVDHSPVRSSSVTTNNRYTPVSRETLKMKAKSNLERDDVNYNSEVVSDKDLLSFEIFSSEENLINRANDKQFGSCNEVSYRNDSVEDLAQSKELKKRMLKSLRSKKPQSNDQVSIKSGDGSEVSKRRSIFSKLKKK